MLPYHPNPLPSCRPRRRRPRGSLHPAAGTHHAAGPSDPGPAPFNRLLKPGPLNTRSKTT
eukprot:377987-Hanusia_phi.AAC.1